MTISDKDQIKKLRCAKKELEGILLLLSSPLLRHLKAKQASHHRISLLGYQKSPTLVMNIHNMWCLAVMLKLKFNQIFFSLLF